MSRLYTTKGTNRQTIYQFVLQYQQAQHYAPTIREICAATGIRSTSTVHGHVCRMIRDGLLTHTAFRPRTLHAIAAAKVGNLHG